MTRTSAGKQSALEAEQSKGAPATSSVSLRRSPGTSNQAMLRLEDHAVPGAGRPLAPAVRAHVESVFDRDLRDIRVHDDGDAARAAAERNARAYTVGRDVVFGADLYKPSTRVGMELLVHEISHTVQQQRGGPSPLANDAAERGARSAAEQYARGERAVTVEGATAVGIARDPAPLLGGPLDQLSDEQIEHEAALLRAWLRRSSIIENDYPRVIATLQQLEQIALRRAARQAPQRGTPARRPADPGLRQTMNPRNQSDAALAVRAPQLQSWIVAHPPASSGTPEGEIYEENALALRASEEEQNRRTRAAAEARAAQFGGASDELLQRERTAILERPFTGDEAPARVAAIERELEQRVPEQAAARRDEFSRYRRGRAYSAILDPDTREVAGYGFIGTGRSDRGTLHVYNLEGREVYRRPEFITGPTSEPIDPIDMFGPALVRGGMRLGTRMIGGLVRAGEAGVEALARVVQNEALTALRVSMARSMRTRVLGMAMRGSGEAIPVLHRGAAGLTSGTADRGMITAVVESGERSAVSSAGSAVESGIAASTRAPAAVAPEASVATDVAIAPRAAAVAPEASPVLIAAETPAMSPAAVPSSPAAVPATASAIRHTAAESIAPVVTRARPPSGARELDLPAGSAPTLQTLAPGARAPSARTPNVRAAVDPGRPQRPVGTERRLGMHHGERTAAEIGTAQHNVTFDPVLGRPIRVTYVTYGETPVQVSPRAFRADEATLGVQGTTAEYTNSGWERGHLAPREAFGGVAEAEVAADQLTNVVPMSPGLNRGAAWRAAEEHAFDLGHTHGGVRVEITPHYEAVPPTLHGRPGGTPIPQTITRTVRRLDGTLIEEADFTNYVSRTGLNANPIAMPSPAPAVAPAPSPPPPGPH